MALRRRWRHGLVLLHRYLAFALGGWLVLAGATGALLLYRDPLDRLLNPALLQSRATSVPAVPPTAGAILAATAQRYPGSQVEVLRLPRDARETFRAILRPEGPRGIGRPRVEASFDANDGAWLGERDPQERSLRPVALLATVHDLHHRLLLGSRGKDAVGLAGVAVCLLVLAGLVLAVPRLQWKALWRSLALKRTTGWKRRIYDLHRSAGVVLGLALAMSAGTGALMAYPEQSRLLVGLLSDVRPLPLMPWRGADGAAGSLADADRAIAEARRRFPQARVTEIHFGGNRAAPLQLLLHAPGDAARVGDRRLFFHARSGELLVVRGPPERSAGESFLHWSTALHAGSWSPWVAPASMLLVALLPAWLLATGLCVWWVKRAARRGRGGATGH